MNYICSFAFYTFHYICYMCCYRSGKIKHEVKHLLKIKEEEEYAMTCLRTYIHVDKHCRQLSTSDDASAKQIESLSLAYEGLFTMPFNIIQDYGFIIEHLDISHNVFSR